MLEQLILHYIPDTMVAAEKGLQEAKVFTDVNANSDEKQVGRKKRAKKHLDEDYVYNSLTEMP